MELVEPGEPDTESAALAFAALQAVQQAAPEYRRCALAMLGLPRLSPSGRKHLQLCFPIGGI
ncbi:hypothetical protein [Streptomyces sp. Inha503]|uniref:hypothetical protein n=1 Tax=Streptomyces sp. Inha503 TaxID=3383314 RepID=UPI0039A22412